MRSDEKCANALREVFGPDRLYPQLRECRREPSAGWIGEAAETYVCSANDPFDAVVAYYGENHRFRERGGPLVYHLGEYEASRWLTIVWRRDERHLLSVSAAPAGSQAHLEYRVRSAFMPGDLVEFRPTPEMLSHGILDPETGEWDLTPLIGRHTIVRSIRGGFYLNTDLMEGTYTVAAFRLVSPARGQQSVARRRLLNPMGFEILEELDSDVP